MKSSVGMSSIISLGQLLLNTRGCTELIIGLSWADNYINRLKMANAYAASNAHAAPNKHSCDCKFPKALYRLKYNYLGRHEMFDWLGCIIALNIMLGLYWCYGGQKLAHFCLFIWGKLPNAYSRVLGVSMLLDSASLSVTETGFVLEPFLPLFKKWEKLIACFWEFLCTL